MLRPRFFPYLVLIVVLALVGSVFLMLREVQQDHPVEEAGPLEPTDWFFLQRAFPYATVDRVAYREAAHQAQTMQQALSQRASQAWTFAGPVNVGGRVTSLAVESFERFFVGSASGGVFKTVDGGQTFVPVGEGMLPPSVGDVALDPSNAERVWVGTGEVNGGGGSLTYGGRGIFSSEDGGATWSLRGLEETSTIGRVVVHPDNPDTVWVAAAGNLYEKNEHRGVYRTLDGGETWTRPLAINDSTGAVDLVVNPQSPDTLYAATWERQRRPRERNYGGIGSGIYRSADGGETWTELTNGLPTDADIGRIGLALAASDPHIVYAVMTDAVGFVRGVYRSEDGGDSWAARDIFPGPSFGWWFGQFRVDPVNPDRVFAPWLDLYRSTDGGSSWQYASGSMHVDQHALWIDPANSQRLIAGNDGGVYRSTNGGQSWTMAQGGWPVTQFYTVEIDATAPERLYGGTQDNGTNRTTTGDLDDWARILGGDGFVVLVDPDEPQYVYAESQYGGRARSTNGGASFSSANNGIDGSEPSNWNTPVVFDPDDPATLYTGTDRVYRSTNRAQSWSPISPALAQGAPGNQVYGTVSAIAVAPSNPEILWAGTDDGYVWVREGSEGAWTDVSEGLPTRWVTRIAVHPTQPQTAYVTLSGYRQGDDMAHVYRTDDAGQTWVPRAEGLPAAPVNDLLIDPQNPEVLVLASDVGVFTSDDGGTSWQAFGTALPAVPVLDLDREGDKLVAATFGRGMYEYDLGGDVTANVPSVTETTMSIEAFPNPFRERVTIRYEIAHPASVELAIFDMSGRRVAVLARGERAMGRHNVTWTAPAAGGTYIVRLSAGDRRVSSRLVHLP